MRPMVQTPTTSVFEDVWLRCVMAQDHRPNVLVQCPQVSLMDAATELVGLCPEPLTVRLLPGRLSLPGDRGGTLLIGDLSTLTAQQQIRLFDWTNRDYGMQVVSITSVPLLPLIEDGRFLEALYYRLNVVTVVAAAERSFS